MLKDSRRCRKAKKANFHGTYRSIVRQIIAKEDFDALSDKESMTHHVKVACTLWDADKYDRRMSDQGLKRLLKKSAGKSLDSVRNKIIHDFKDSNQSRDEMLYSLEWFTKPSCRVWRFGPDFPIVDGLITEEPRVSRKRRKTNDFNAIGTFDKNVAYVRFSGVWHRAILADKSQFKRQMPWYNVVLDKVCYNTQYSADAIGQCMSDNSRSKLRACNKDLSNKYVLKLQTINKHEMMKIDKFIIDTVEKHKGYAFVSTNGSYNSKFV
jgi:hypothetical protein